MSRLKIHFDWHNNGAICFIHGIGGGFGTWRTVPVEVQLRCSLLPWCSFDVSAFSYETSLLFSNFRLGDAHIQQGLQDVLDDGADSKYDHSILVGHSQGGLLAKLYCLRRERGSLTAT